MEAKRRARKENAAKKRDMIRQAKSVQGTDCGGTYPYYVMQLDHLRDKSFGLGRAAHKDHGIGKIQEEIEKCEPVCANCHAERTQSRMKLKT